MKSLVLGSSGQVGYHLVNFLKNNNDTVFTFDVVDNKYEDLRLFPNYILENYIDQCDFIYFLAFDVGGSKYLSQYQKTYNFIYNNTALMVNTFELIKKHNKPFIFASSQMSNMNHSTYGILKKLGEEYTKSLNGMVVHFWNVYGIEHDEQKSHVITDFIKKALSSNTIDMITDGNEKRQFLHADDCSEALYILANKFYSLDKNQNYHITSFEWTTIIDIAKFIQLKTNCQIIPGKKQDTVQLDKMNPPDKYILQYWQPKITLNNGIENIIEYYKKY